MKEEKPTQLPADRPDVGRPGAPTINRPDQGVPGANRPGVKPHPEQPIAPEVEPPPTIPPPPTTKPVA